MGEMLKTLVRAARAGGAILREAYENGPEWIREKGKNDFVTAADEASEAVVQKVLNNEYPSIPLLAEEGSGAAKGGEERLFCVDPLDGTNNFVHGVPIFCVSVGLIEGNKPCMGAVYDPVHDELFAGGKGMGATMNAKPIATSKKEDLSRAFVATGFPFKEMANLDRYVEGFKAACRSTGGIRRCGAAALDLAWTACGRFDGFWEWGLWPWDVAAATAILRGAGGTVTDFSGGEDFLFGRNIIAGGSKTMAEAIRGYVRSGEEQRS